MLSETSEEKMGKMGVKMGVSVHFISVTNYRCHLPLMKLRYGAEYS